MVRFLLDVILISQRDVLLGELGVVVSKTGEVFHFGEGECAACIGVYSCVTECSILLLDEVGGGYPRELGFNCEACPEGSQGDGLQCSDVSPDSCIGCVDVDGEIYV